MTRLDFLQVLGLFLLIFLTSTVLGLNFIGLTKRITKGKKETSIPIEHIGAGMLIGIGIIGHLSLILGIFGLFNKTVLVSLILICLLVSIKEIFRLLRSVASHLKTMFGEYGRDIIALIGIAFALVTLGGLYLAAMQPPYTSDELHYHLPEVQQVVDARKIDLNFGGHPFYGNIPKLMEIIFAMGKTISSYQLSHALNFAIFLSFLFIVFGFVKKYYGLRAASFSILLLSWFDDFTWNATSGFIDAATTAFEISALLFILDWTSKKDKVSFTLSAILLGFAVSIKYSPLPTAIFILGIIIFKLFKDNTRKVTEILKGVSPYILISFIWGGF